MQSEDRIAALEKKFFRMGTQLRWWGVVIFVAGVVMAIYEISGGIVTFVAGLIVALQGALMRYYFQAH